MTFSKVSGKAIPIAITDDEGTPLPCCWRGLRTTYEGLEIETPDGGTAGRLRRGSICRVSVSFPGCPGIPGHDYGRFVVARSRPTEIPVEGAVSFTIELTSIPDRES